MESTSAGNVFDRSGLAALSDFHSAEWLERFRSLGREQDEFLAKDSAFRSPHYTWPRDPLHTWSRVWEYPYVFHHLKRLRKSLPERARVIDFGSGVTFFPFSVSRLGFHVTCVDVDPDTVQSVGRAAQCVDAAPGAVDAVLAAPAGVALDDAAAEVVYCISVLEHVDEPVRELSEIARILRPGGTLILTIDLDLQGKLALGVEARARFLRAINGLFEWGMPPTTVHPADVLTSNTGPFPFGELRGLGAARFRLRQLAKGILGRRRLVRPVWLACEGFVLRRPSSTCLE
jgi:SAM-dependent methyltransferase